MINENPVPCPAKTAISDLFMHREDGILNRYFRARGVLTGINFPILQSKGVSGANDRES